jgi:ribonucleoside-diphosphate reductase beta chain
MGIFDKRVAFKPFEYKDAVAYKEAIQHSYWLVSEWNFLSDVHDFNTKLDEVERLVLKRTLLAISQIEVAVKKFWGKLGDKLPKAEFEQVGAVFSANEVIHSDSYSHLLEILGLNDEFDDLLQNPVIQGRVDYLTKYLKGAAENSNEGFTLTLTLFSLFIENVSLFSQFLIVKSFNKFKQTLKDIDNVINATRYEEEVHALFGVYLIKIIKKENPEWFNDEFYDKVYRACRKAFEAESKIIEWIFAQGELPFQSKESVIEFIKKRFNDSVKLIGGKKVFDVDRKLLKESEWFYEDTKAELSTDFFHKKPVAYSKKTKPVTEEDLF